jgi:hypothetical protein
MVAYFYAGCESFRLALLNSYGRICGAKKAQAFILVITLLIQAAFFCDLMQSLYAANKS